MVLEYYKNINGEVMKYLFKTWGMILILAVSSVVNSQDAAESEMSEEQKAYFAKALETWNSMDRKTGTIELAGGVAKLEVPADFYYLNPQDTSTVLTEFWGNPPSEPLLGMLFAEGSTPFDRESWGVTIEYSQEGYVSDEDADDIDYDDLLSSMQEGTREESKQRADMGYESIELVGWASSPFYDKESHKLHWAQEIRFGDQPVHTLNYNIRVLGRKGVLVLNFIAGMDQLDLISSKVNTVVDMADFNAGSTYDDFNPEIDEVAAYGIGALVAGKLAAKTGLLAGLLIILKKFGVFILIGLGALFGKIFSKKQSQE